MQRLRHLCPLGLQGSLEEAISCYERSLAAAPNLAVVQANLAVALTDRGTHVKLAGGGPGAVGRLH